jgi:DMSO/TMAO reductase YedYZ molybdopterin-dependent catalytic subunit
MGDRDALKYSRRAFLLLVTGAARAAAAPTQAYARPDPRYGALTYDKIIVTPIEDFYTIFVGAGTAHLGNVPRVDHDRWSLTLDGLVENPQALDWQAVEELPAVEEMRTVECTGNPVGGPLIGNAVWRGFPLRPLLERVGVRREAVRARFYAADGYSTSVDLKWLMRDGVLMAYAMNGAPLPVEQGYPLRILIPGLYDQKMPRWITRIEFIDHVYTGYWERHGWSDVAAVKTHAMFRSPPPRASISGYVYLQGIAYAGDRAIIRVEVSADDGPWLEARLVRGASSLVWTQWYYRWQPDVPGSHAFRVRATDEAGFTQSGQAMGRRGSAFPDGTDEIDRLVLIVRS